MKSTTGPIPNSEDDTKELETGRKHLWLCGLVYYKDWFDLPRVERFTYRWECGYEEGKAGFRLHSRQSEEYKNDESN